MMNHEDCIGIYHYEVLYCGSYEFQSISKNIMYHGGFLAQTLMAQSIFWING